MHQIWVRAGQEVPRPEQWRALQGSPDLLQLEPNLELSGEFQQDLDSRRWSSCLCLGSMYESSRGCVPQIVFQTIILFYFQPPREFNLKSNWSGAPVEFFESVNYTCAGPEFHFEADFDQLAWQGARCLSNGSWQLLEPWPSCLKSKLQIQYIDNWSIFPVVQPSTAHLLHLSLQDWCAGTEIWNLVCLPICTTISCEWPSLEALFTPIMSPY